MKKPTEHTLVICLGLAGLAFFAIIFCLQSRLPLLVKLALALGFLALAGYGWLCHLQHRHKCDSAALQAQIRAMLHPTDTQAPHRTAVSVAMAGAAAAPATTPAEVAKPAPKPAPMPTKAAVPAEVPLQAPLQAQAPVPMPAAAPVFAPPVMPAPPVTPAPVAACPEPQAAPPLAPSPAPLPDVPSVPDAPSAPILWEAPKASPLPDPLPEPLPDPEPAPAPAPAAAPPPPPHHNPEKETLEQIFARIRPVAELDNDLPPTMTEEERRETFERLKAADLERQRRRAAALTAAAAAGSLHPTGQAQQPEDVPPVAPLGVADRRELQRHVLAQLRRPAAGAESAAATAPQPETPPPPPRPTPEELVKAAARYTESTGKTPPPSVLEAAMAAGVPLDTPLDELPPLPDDETATERMERNRVLVETRATAQQLLKDRAIHRALEEARQREERRKAMAATATRSEPKNNEPT
ncbi:MAG: hypothetical protein PHO10_06270 [Gemmiger sp.]|nr:hypothetical protein [Gemmiger sp.]